MTHTKLIQTLPSGNQSGSTIKGLGSNIFNTAAWRKVSHGAAIIFLLLGGNSLFVAFNVSKDTKKDFVAQASTLSHESGQIIKGNYSILEGIVYNLQNDNPDNIINNFKKYSLAIGKYTDSLVLFADSSHDIRATTAKNPVSFQDLNIGSRDYLQNILRGPRDIQIGHPVRGMTTQMWSLPIAKGVFKEKKHLGTVILSTPLKKFSERFHKAHIILQTVKFEHNTSFTDLANKNKSDFDIADMNTKHLDNKVSVSSILKVAIFGYGDITILADYRPLPTLKGNAVFVIPASYICFIFLQQLLYNSFILFALYAFLIFPIQFFFHRIFKKMNILEKKLEISVPKFKNLVPDYASIDFITTPPFYQNKLVNLEAFVNSGGLIINTLEKQQNLIIAKEAQLSALHNRFLACIIALEQKSLNFFEDIEDIYVMENSVKNKRNKRSKFNTGFKATEQNREWLSLFENIYNYSKTYEEYILSLKESMIEAGKILKNEKLVCDVAQILKEKFTSKCIECIVINNQSNDDTAQQQLNKNDNIIFYPDALEQAISSLLMINTNEKPYMYITQSSSQAIIEIVFHVKGEHSIAQETINTLLEKARFFALLDEGIIDLYHSKEKLTFTLVYNRRIIKER